MSADGYRSALSRFATGITIVTALDGSGKPAGMTASAMASVSLEPPLILLCVNPDADFHAVLLKSRRFALNVLSSNQERLSRAFSTNGIDKFAGLELVEGPDGIPFIADAVAHIVCEPWRRYDEVGDHTVFVGHVVYARVRDSGKPLIHYRSRYTTTDGS